MDASAQFLQSPPRGLGPQNQKPRGLGPQNQKPRGLGPQNQKPRSPGPQNQKPRESEAGNWVRQVTRNLLGQVTEIRGPNREHQRFLYSTAGHVRFSQDPPRPLPGGFYITYTIPSGDASKPV